MKQTLFPNSSATASVVNDYATAADFQKFFASEMTALFRLALLLTADPDDSERCVILAMRECVAAEHIFKCWIAVWARRIVVRHAIRMGSARQERSARGHLNEGAVFSATNETQVVPGSFRDSAAIFTLAAFERLVYVTSILEHYPIADCALLLGRPLHEVREAQSRAVGQVAALEQQWRDAQPVMAARNSNSVGIFDQQELDCSCGTLLQ